MLYKETPRLVLFGPNLRWADMAKLEWTWNTGILTLIDYKSLDATTDDFADYYQLLLSKNMNKRMTASMYKIAAS